MITPVEVGCASSPCKNGATCFGNGINFVCMCQPNFSGTLCEIIKNTTLAVGVCPSACKNGATCIPMGVNDFYCTCLSQYTGKSCEQVIPSCPNTFCQNSGTCVLINNGQSATCACPAPFTGIQCTDTIVDRCLGSPCMNFGTCTSGPITYTCKCPMGYAGKRCEIATSNPTPCDSNPCQNAGTCNLLNGSIKCTCAPGYTGLLCEADNRPAVCDLNCAPGYCFSNPATRPPFACFCPNNSIHSKSCPT